MHTKLIFAGMTLLAGMNAKIFCGSAAFGAICRRVASGCPAIGRKWNQGTSGFQAIGQMLLRPKFSTSTITLVTTMPITTVLAGTIPCFLTVQVVMAMIRSMLDNDGTIGRTKIGTLASNATLRIAATMKTNDRLARWELCSNASRMPLSPMTSPCLLPCRSIS